MLLTTTQFTSPPQCHYARETLFNLMNHIRNVKDINNEIPFLFKLDPGYNDTT